MLKRVILTSAIALTISTTAKVGAIEPNRPTGEHEHDHEQEEKQKYTCPMHPEVITDHPGNCPKCGMKLVPLKEKKRGTSNVQLSTSKVGAIDPNRPSHAHNHAPSVAAATYGAAGEHEHEKMQMEMHSTINLADPMTRQASRPS